MIAPAHRNWIYVVSVAVLLAGGAVALTLLTPRRGPIGEADELREAGRHSEALDRYQAILAQDPDSEEALWGVVLIHTARADNDMALEYLRRYLQAHPRGRHVHEAGQALSRIRRSLVASETPSPELAPGPGPGLPAPPPDAVVQKWQQALDLEQRGQFLDAISVYAGLVSEGKDGRVRAAALERIARCEARRPPFDYSRIRHFYLRAARAYRDLDDAQNSARCKELAYLAQEYARVSGERQKLAEERRAFEALRPPEQPAPSPGDLFARALESYRAGNDDTAEKAAARLVGTVPEANYILGMIHVRQGLWDDARQELEEYLTKLPEGEFADEVRAALLDIKGKRPLLVDTFSRGADKWRLADADGEARPATEVMVAADSSDGPCMRLESGEGAYTSVDAASVATIRLRIYEPSANEPPLAPTRVRLYSGQELTCAPLSIEDRGYRFVSQSKPTVPRGAGWRELIIDVSKEIVTAHVDAELIGEVRREGGFSGLHIETDEAQGAGPVYIDDVQIVEHL